MLEGEYIPYHTDYFDPMSRDDNPLTEPGVGHIRPFDREYRQGIIDAHMARDKKDFDRFMRISDVVECDSFVTSKDLCRSHDPDFLRVADAEVFFEKQELTRSEEDFRLCRVDIIDRMLMLSRNLEGIDRELVDKLVVEFDQLVPDNYEPLRYRRLTIREEIRDVADELSSFWRHVRDRFK